MKLLEYVMILMILSNDVQWTALSRSVLLRLSLALISVIVLPVALVAAVANAASDLTRTGPSSQAIVFDIPSQPLSDALLTYAGATGIDVIVDHTLVSDQRSPALTGPHTTDTALRTLLTGTGLDFRKLAERSYIVFSPPVQEPPRQPSWFADNAQREFFASVQLAISRVLCAQMDPQLGRYRLALSIWIDADGRITDARILSDDIDKPALGKVVNDFKRLSVEAPPPKLEQPVTFVILPRPPAGTGDCVSPPVADRRR